MNIYYFLLLPFSKRFLKKSSTPAGSAEVTDDRVEALRVAIPLVKLEVDFEKVVEDAKDLGFFSVYNKQKAIISLSNICFKKNI